MPLQLLTENDGGVSLKVPVAKRHLHCQLLRPIMKTILASFLAIIALAWGWEVLSPDHLSAGSLPWALRQNALYLSGLWSISLMSLAMVLATRPAWLERPLGGMDRIFRLHKWSGILAGSFAVLHWLVEMSDDLLKATVGRGGRIRKDDFSAFAEPVQDLAEDLGEWAFYVLLALLAFTLWKRFSYRLWRPLHRTMPVLYLLLAFHAVVLAPAGYWDKPIGLLLAMLLSGGAVASLLSLTRRIGRGRQVSGKVLSVENPSPEIVAVRCRLNEGWRGHRPGQFAFVTFDSSEGPHPFTIASADRGDRTVTFAIKALGDYTCRLARDLVVGSQIRIEGPYGRFDLNRSNPRARQIWIAGGIGITPFLAWLESLQGERATTVAADLHYYVRDRTNDPFVQRLQTLCTTLPGVRLHLHDQQSTPVTAEQLAAMHGTRKQLEVWFCGPRGLGEILRDGLRQAWPGRLRFHQEAFELR